MSNRPLTLLHGFLGSPRDWDGVRAHLKGETTRAPAIPPAADWNDGVRQIANETPSGSILIGYSMGARIALGVAIEGQVELGGLVFISGRAGLRASERAVRWRQDRQIVARLRRESPEEFLAWWYAQSVFSGDSAELKRNLVAEKSSFDLTAEADRLRTYSVARQPDYAPCLNQLRIPVMFIAGRDDAKYANVARRLATACARAGCEIVESCGHIVHRGQPEAVAQLVRGINQRQAYEGH